MPVVLCSYDSVSFEYLGKARSAQGGAGQEESDVSLLGRAMSELCEANLVQTAEIPACFP